MAALIKLKVSELDNSLIAKLQSLFAANQDAVLTITIGGLNGTLEDKKTDYLETLRRSKDHLENNRNLISFTMEELEAYANSRRL